MGIMGMLETLDDLMELVDLLTFTRDLLDRKRKKKHKKKKHKRKHKRKHKKKHTKRHTKRHRKRHNCFRVTRHNMKHNLQKKHLKHLKHLKKRHGKKKEAKKSSGESSDFLTLIRDLLDHKRKHRKHKKHKRHDKKSCASSKTKGSGSSGASSDSKFDLQKFQELALKKHNELRALHKDTPPMVLDKKLCDDCQAYAHKLAFTKAHGHSHVHGVGENIWGSTGAKSAKTDVGARASQSWYNEIKNYNFHTGKGNGSKSYKNGATGHFTAVVWDNSVKLGIGMAYNPKTRKTYVVGRYLPPGNFSGTSSHKKHVHPLK